MNTPITLTPRPVRMQWDIKIPLRDGTHLSATVYRPADQNEPEPCLLTLTPYTAQRLHPRASYFAARGFPFLAVDARGRGNSEGIFRPYIQEAEDGHDIVEWIARQPYCNGRVAMFSGSYEGYDQWAVAKEFPAHLATIAPSVSAGLGIDFPMRNNIPYPYVMRWLSLTAGHTSQDRVFEDQKFWRDQYRAWFLSGRPFRELDTLTGNPSPIFQEWLSHPERDAYWDAFLPGATAYAKIDLPILSLTGSYDANQPGALHFYREHLRHASPAAAAKHYLVIGPWDHGGSLSPKPEFGGISFGPAALLDVMQLHLDWYKWTLRGGAKPAFLQRNVAYYVTGAEKWRYAESLESVTDQHQLLYLDSQGSASRAHNSGLLGESVGEGAGDTYVYDPRDLGIAAVEAQLEYPSPPTLLRPTFPNDSLTDQTLVFANEGKALIYHSLPFARATEISGFFKLTAWMAINQPDTDFLATVYELTPEGGSILLTSDLLRARYREDLHTPRLIRTEEPLRYDFNHFTFISRQLKQGSRLRLVIGPLHSIYFQKNYNSGKPVAEESMEDARAVTVTLHHDKLHPSVLHVPLGHLEND